ncbi:unnamed protein product [Sphagnum troendelagicum]|uniref:At3g05675-like ankyrin-like domain-containing protein n=1 Tax=Sphagnum troendelagicum TaxID=128251 RepID=A0ABP0UJQ1_9BRYO
MVYDKMWFGDEKTSDIILQLVPTHDSESPASPAIDKPLHSVANEVLLLKYPKHKQKSGHNSPRHDELSNHGDSRGRPLSISNLDAGQPNHKRRQPSKKRRKVHVHLDITTLHVHSAALCRCQYFKACLGDRWSEDANGARTIQLTMEAHSNPNVYISCIELLYKEDLSPATSFQCVGHALNILRVAAQLLFQDCIMSSMQYLAAMPWRAEEQLAIHTVLTGFHLPPTPDLVARLGTFSPAGAMSIELPSLVKRVLENLLSTNTQECLSFKDRRAVECSCWLHEDDIPDLSKAMVWLLNIMLELKVADDAVKNLSNDKELAQITITLVEQMKSNICNEFLVEFFQVLVRMLHAVGKGEIILENATRLALIDTWLPIIRECEYVINGELRESAEQAVNTVLKTLPLFDQECILISWLSKEPDLDYNSIWPNLSEAFDAWCHNFRSTMHLLSGSADLKYHVFTTNDDSLSQM